MPVTALAHRLREGHRLDGALVLEQQRERGRDGGDAKTGVALLRHVGSRAPRYGVGVYGTTYRIPLVGYQHSLVTAAPANVNGGR